MAASSLSSHRPWSCSRNGSLLGPLICFFFTVFSSTKYLPVSSAASQSRGHSLLSAMLVERAGRSPDENLLKPVRRGHQLSDWEVAAVALTRSIIANPTPATLLVAAKVAFLFRVEGPLPLETLWSRFLNGHAGEYSIYIHSRDNHQYRRQNLKTDLFVGRSIPSRSTKAGFMSEVEVERRLLSWALLDTANAFFVLVSHKCVPIRSFTFIRDYLIPSRTSFVDLSPGDSLQYHLGMDPEIPRHKFVTGSEWVAVHRRHATAVVADTLFYDKFHAFCRELRCVPVEHYLHTLLHSMDPKGLANYTVTHVPSMQGKQVSYADMGEVISSIQVVDSVQRHGDGQLQLTCTQNGSAAPCFLFMEGVEPAALSPLENLPVKILGY